MGGCFSSVDNPFASEQYTEEKKLLGEELFKVDPGELSKVEHYSIVAITCLNKMRKLSCGSGFLISADLVLTAAHNIVDRHHQCENTDFKIYLPTSNGKVSEFFEVEAKRYPTQFTKSSKISDDFALLKLSRPVRHNDFLQLSLPCEVCYNNNGDIGKGNVGVFGYPSQTSEKKYNYKNFDMYGKQFQLSQYGLIREKRILQFNSLLRRIGYQISTGPGQSGCPVIFQKAAIAIHIGGMLNKQFNVGRLIDVQMFNTLLKWSNEIKGRTFKLKDLRMCSHNKSLLKDRESQVRSKETVDFVDEPSVKKSKFVHKSKMTMSQSPNIKVTLSRQGLQQYNAGRDPSLMHLDLSFNKLSRIDLSRNINLTHLQLQNNQISAIDITNSPNLVYLDLSGNKIFNIYIGNNPELTYFNGSYNNLTEMDLRKNKKLIEVYLSRNRLKKIYFKYVPQQIYYEFESQQSQVCEVMLESTTSDEWRCKKVEEEWQSRYSNSNSNCVYIFTTAVRNY